jgi:hypothetical protein
MKTLAGCYNDKMKEIRMGIDTMEQSMEDYPVEDPEEAAAKAEFVSDAQAGFAEAFAEKACCQEYVQIMTEWLDGSG